MSFKNKQTKSIGLAAQKVVDALCARLEAGVNPWVKPWSVSGEATDDPEAFAVNLFTGKPYTGINQAMLAPGYYTTAKQAFAHGGSVAKGRGQTAVFYKDGEIRVKDEEVELEDVIEADGKQIGVVAYEGEPSEDSTGWREAICEALEIAREQRA